LLLLARSLKNGVQVFLLFFSSCSKTLSCCLLSLAHFANSSWLLVAFNSVRNLRNCAFNSLCSAEDLETPARKRLYKFHNYVLLEEYAEFLEVAIIPNH
jgi:hypothetical protein